ncbi:MAG: hypothetical protein ABIJ34_05010 [archaeon]
MTLIAYLFSLFGIWIDTLFVLPFRNIDMLWLLVPIWIAWFFAEFFQEKIGTSMGNAITNAVVILWGSIDCTRQTFSLIAKKALNSTLDILGRFGLVFLLFIYGAIIIHLGIKGNKIIKYIGRVRIVTYVFAMFVPIFYNAISFSVEHLLATILFFPLFYFTIELLDFLVPDPHAIRVDQEDTNSQRKKTVQVSPSNPHDITKQALLHSRAYHNHKPK